MDVLRNASIALFLGALLVTGTGCQMGYYFKSAYNQFSMMSRRVPLDDAIKDPKLDEDTHRKLAAAREAHEFAINAIGLKETANYTTFVQLDRPYVSWVVSAAPRWKLEHHQWSYPIVGKMPYKGFASEEDAREEQRALEHEDLDTYLRGVSAYSTLGWFKDSVLSSMLRAEEYDLVNTIFHETTHTTLYVRNSADFNERLAVFVGNKGTEQFYRAKEGLQSPTLRRIADENLDDRTFSDFIGPQLKELKEWYEKLPASEHDEARRRDRLKSIQAEFAKSVLPRLKTKSYSRFAEIELNNARLMYFRTYMQDLGDFEELFSRAGERWPDFLRCAKSLETAEKPEEALKDLNRKLKAEGLSIACP